MAMWLEALAFMGMAALGIVAIVAMGELFSLLARRHRLEQRRATAKLEVENALFGVPTSRIQQSNGSLPGIGVFGDTERERAMGTVFAMGGVRLARRIADKWEMERRAGNR